MYYANCVLLTEENLYWVIVLSNLCYFFLFTSNHSQVIFGKSNGPEFLQEVCTPVTYHNKQVHIIELYLTV